MYTYVCACVCVALDPRRRASPLISGKNVGHLGHLSQAMTHNVQLHVGELAARLSQTLTAVPERKRRSCRRCGTCGGRLYGEQTPRPSDENHVEKLVSIGLGVLNEPNGSFLAPDAVGTPLSLSRLLAPSPFSLLTARRCRGIAREYTWSLLVREPLFAFARKVLASHSPMISVPAASDSATVPS